MEIQQDIDLLPYNTFKVPCQAKYFVVVKTLADVTELMQSEIFQTNYCLVLWGGSNLLFGQLMYEWLIIKNEIEGKEIIEDTKTSVKIKVGAGENRDTFVRRTLEHGYAWLENFINIPGTVGASPVQNIWAYGKEVKEHIIEVHGIALDDTSMTIQKIPASACKFGYRDSIFKNELAGNFLITHVVFEIQKYNPATYVPTANYIDITKKLEALWRTAKDLTPTQLADMIVEIRTSKFPNLEKYGTAGSFFKNTVVSEEKYEELKKLYPRIVAYPVEWGVKIPTWRLLDHALGRRGKRVWNVWCRENQALVLVNHAWADGAEIVDFSKDIQQRVFKLLGIEIIPEVSIVYIIPPVIVPEELWPDGLPLEQPATT